jgi:hypothetical protein
VVPPRSDRIARVPPYSRTILRITRTGLSPTQARHSKRFRLSQDRHWPSPRSLATTSGVSVDVLSSGYLDVSVPRVCLKPPILFGGLIPSLDARDQKSAEQQSEDFSDCRSLTSEPWHRRWVSPFGNPRIKASSQLPAAYRSVVRPSSPLSAKASTKCPYFT